MKKSAVEMVAINKKIAEFMGSDIFIYRESGRLDINGKMIMEGSIINANGYNSMPEENYFHIVEFWEGEFGSNVYGDFDKLSYYQTIEVIGHVTDYVHLLNDAGNIEGDGDIGNISSAMRGESTCLYHRSWNQLMTIVEKIESLRDKFDNFYSVQIGMSGSDNPNQCTITAPLWKTQVFADSKREATWLAVGEFVEWYNEHKSISI